MKTYTIRCGVLSLGFVAAMACNLAYAQYGFGGGYRGEYSEHGWNDHRDHDWHGPGSYGDEDRDFDWGHDADWDHDHDFDHYDASEYRGPVGRNFHHGIVPGRSVGSPAINRGPAVRGSGPVGPAIAPVQVNTISGPSAGAGPGAGGVAAPVAGPGAGPVANAAQPRASNRQPAVAEQQQFRGPIAKQSAPANNVRSVAGQQRVANSNAVAVAKPAIAAQPTANAAQPKAPAVAAAPATPAAPIVEVAAAAMVGQWQASNKDIAGREMVMQLDVESDGSATLRIQTRGQEPFELKLPYTMDKNVFALGEGDQKVVLGEVASAETDKLIIKKDGATLTFSKI